MTLEKLYSVSDICARYQVSAQTARKLMRDMPHLKKPLMVSERSVEDWERKNTLPPESATRAIIRKEKKH